jgi:cell division septal protein FtsQ
VKVIINPQQQPRKNYKNLPEREPHKINRPQPKRVVEEVVEDEPMLDSPDLEVEEEVLVEEAPSHPWLHGKRGAWLFLSVLLVLGTAAYFAFGFERDLTLEKIVVEGNTQLTDKEIISLADIDRDQKFYDIDLKAIAARMMKHSLVKAAYPTRESNPATIILRVEERKPVALLRVASTGEALLIDADGKILRPKRMTGLKDAESILDVPLLSGISDKDTQSFLAMSRLVMKLGELDSGALIKGADELKKTPTGAYVLYMSGTHTPIFIGSPKDEPFIAALDKERDPEGVQQKREEPLFDKQLRLLSGMWKQNILPVIRKGGVLYVDARFDGQVIVKGKQGASIPNPAQAMNIDSTATPAIAQDQAGNTQVLNTTRPLAQGHR